MKEIVIDEKEYAKAPIDDKNVMSDSILDSLFDDSYAWNKKEAVGFIKGYPVYTRYSSNMLILKMVKPNPSITDASEWMNQAICNVTGERVDYKLSIAKENFRKSLLFDDNNVGMPECQLIMTFTFLGREMLVVDFNYNCKG